ncbi:MAG: tRNA (adenosine(37)-N6)-threonylcarbamoyltransferase complex dimerization subunit type 1 TsaB [Acidobacteriota bacterium]|nr:tRNA (adenosine(37)-N6)-threonylcarbamoyltransferase complex dimerization subunit type 1 TsaB [Acidobacteriota bacterium]
MTQAGETLEEVLLHAPEGFGQILFERIRRMLDSCGSGLERIDLYAAASGPGSFTGVRVGLACVKGLAEATGKPAVAVSNLSALAEFGTLDRRATVIDARRGEVYAALYDARGDAVIPEAAIRFADFLASLPPGPLEFLASDFTPFHASLAGTPFEHARIGEVPRAQAAAIGRIAARRFESTALDTNLDANYVRRADAEMLWRD